MVRLLSFRLGDMKFLWKKHFSLMLQTMIKKQIIISLETVDPIGLGSILKGLSGMEYEWTNGGATEKAIFKSIVAYYHPLKRKGKFYNSQGIANSIYYLGELSKISEKATNGKKILLNQEVLDSLRNGIEQCCLEFKPEIVHGVIRG
jgi:hypothetical protein